MVAAPVVACVEKRIRRRHKRKACLGVAVAMVVSMASVWLWSE